MTRDEQSAIKEMKYILKHYQKEELDISISTIRTALGYIDKLQKENKILSLESQGLFESINCNDDTSLSFRYKELKKENKHLKEQLLISNSLDNMYDLYISKDKIREKIEELEEDKEENLQGIQELKILLEEE